MGWTMAIIRPIAAVVTAVAAGLAVEVGQPTEDPDDPGEGDPDPDGVEAGADAAEPVADEAPEPVEPREPVEEAAAISPPVATCSSEVRETITSTPSTSTPVPSGARTSGGRSATLSGTSSTICPTGFSWGSSSPVWWPRSCPPRWSRNYLGEGVLPLFVMAAVGIPIYICASASTPIAAALMLKGLSPGAALVFLLTGPATNLGAIAVLVRFLGKRVVGVYLVVVALMSIALGFVVDVSFEAFGIVPEVQGGVDSEPGAVKSVRRGALPRPHGDEHLPDRGARGAGTGRCVASPRQRLRAHPAVAHRAHRGGDRGGVARDRRPARPPRSAGDGPPPRRGGTAPASSRVSISGPRPRSPRGGSWRSRPPGVVEIGTEAVGEGPPGRTEPCRDVEANASCYLTGDENLLSVAFQVEYGVSDSVAYDLGVAEPDRLVRLVARSAMVDAMARRPIDDIYTVARPDIEDEVRQRVQDELDGYGAGIQVQGVALLDVHAPPSVHFQFRDIASAKEEARTSEHRARANAIESHHRARGEADRERLSAEAARDAEIDRATGEAGAFLAQSRAARGARELAETRLYLETVEEVLAGVPKVIRSGDGTDVGSLARDDPGAGRERGGRRCPRGRGESLHPGPSREAGSGRRGEETVMEGRRWLLGLVVAGIVGALVASQRLRGRRHRVRGRDASREG